MTQKTLYLTEEELTAQGVFDSTHLLYTIDNFVFKEEKKFFHSQIQEALNFCNHYTDQNIQTMIVKSQYYLTIWLDTQSSSATIPNNSVPTKKPNQIEPELNSPSHSNSSNKVIRKYRGQYIEIEAPTPHNQQQPQNRRKYRGQYID